MTTPDPETEVAAGEAGAGGYAIELPGLRSPRSVAARSAGAPAAERVEPAHAAAAWWEAVYRAHVVAVHRFAAARTGNRPDAEDVTAQVFLRALPRLRADAAEGETRAYLFAAARSVLAEHWAARYGPAAEPLDEGRAAGGTDPAVANAAADPGGDRGERRVHAILSRLPETYRRVLELRFLEGCSVGETAERLGVSVANAKVIQFRALRRARLLEVGS